MCFVGVRLFVYYVFMGAVASLHWTFPSSTFCKAGFMNRYCSNLTFFVEYLVSQSIVIGSIVVWACIQDLLVSDFLTFMYSTESRVYF